ncbi:MAG: T9SS C-terminal target domain-containing protein [Balneola sp.]|nr:MAG: T9SS C-terminal target domain-containing protein [Balneola sp.]
MKSTFSLLFILLITLTIQAQDKSILFQVDMSYQIKKGSFDLSSEFVDIAGTFNGWGGNLIQLNDADDDSVYSVEVGGFTIGQEIEYKFRYNGAWDDREEFPGAGNNRRYTVAADTNIILVWYNNEVDPDGPPTAGFETSSRSIFQNSLVQFNDLSSGKVTSYSWAFEGGTPDTSSDAEPAIRYLETGLFDVELIVSDGEVFDTLFYENYIEVNERVLAETKWWNESVFYEIFVRSFYDSDGDGIGDFNGLTEKLDYLNDGDPNTDTDLGITGIWLMPIHDSPSYHGYDVVDYRSINPDYGTLEDFKNFLSEAHDRGIRVIIDLVMNHSSTQHPWFEQSAANDPQYRDFYRWSNTNPGYTGPWGQTVWHSRNGEYYYGLFWGGMPDLNYDSEALKDSMFAVAEFWLSDIGVDGFRQDAVLYIDEDGSQLKNTDETFQFWQDFNTHVKSINPDAFNVGEAWEPTNIVLDYISNDRLDYAFEFDLANAILGSVNSGNAASIISQMQKVYDVYPFLQYGTFLTNHDQNRVMNVLGQDINKAKVAASLLLTLPGIPYLYYGEEVGMLGQKPDEDIRLPMQWSDESNSGFTSGSPWRNPNSNFADFNVEVMSEDQNSLFNHYRNLIHLRNDHEPFQLGELEFGNSTTNSTIGFSRFTDGLSAYTVLINLSGNQVTSNFTFTYNAVNNNELIDYYLEPILFSEPGFGATTPMNDSWMLHEVELAPYEIKVYKLAPRGLSNEDGSRNIDSFELMQNYPNPFNPTSTISFYLPQASEVKLQVFDITGRLVSTLVNEKRIAGSHSVQFEGSTLSSGVYFYRLEAGDFVSTKKMTLIK